MIETLAHAWQVLLDVFDSGVLWKVILFLVIVSVLRGAYRIQKAQDNDVDFFDLIRDFSSPMPDGMKRRPISGVKTFYAVGATITTVVYALACTRPGATITDINIFTITYGALWTASQFGNKLAERPAVTQPVIVPPQPSPVTINNQQQDGKS